MGDRNVIAIILGGGRGTRLHPLTASRAKPAVPLAGKYRLIDIPISNCINSGFSQIYVLTQFLTASLHKHVYSTYQFDAFSDGFVELLPAEQTLTSTDWFQGTADAVRRQMHHFRTRHIEDALILSGDHLYRMDFGKFLEFHRGNRADFTVGAVPVSIDDASRYGILKAGSDGQIIRYHEKPQAPEDLAEMRCIPDRDKPFLASMGIYIFRMDILRRILNQKSGADFGKDIIPSAIADHRVYAYPFNGYWEDIGTIEAFYNANLSLTRFDAPFDFYDPNQPIYTRSRFLPPSWIDGCHLHRAVIADGCQMLNAGISECIIGLRSVIRAGVKLTRVIMMGADYYEVELEKIELRCSGRPLVGIGENSSIERAIIDKNARIGQDVIIQSHEGDPDSEGEGYVIRDGIVVIHKNASIPDGTVI
jgi:glucose-1-phosphate adenylyltransferase